MLQRGETMAYGEPVGWLEHEIDEWIFTRLRRGGGSARPVPEPPAHFVILREKEVHRRTGLSRVHRWRLESEGRFPRRVQLSDVGASRGAIIGLSEVPATTKPPAANARQGREGRGAAR